MNAKAPDDAGAARFAKSLTPCGHLAWSWFGCWEVSYAAHRARDPAERFDE